MNKIVLIIVFLFCLPLVLAQDQTELSITLLDAFTKEQISDVFVKVDTNGAQAQYYVEADKELGIQVDPKNQDIALFVDQSNTPGADYYGELSIQINSAEHKALFAYLYPVASLQGFVKDELENNIASAELDFSCSGPFDLNFPEKTDQFGAFSLEAVPEGNCRVFAAFGNEIGVVDFETKQGEEKNIEVKLEGTRVIPQEKNPLSLFLLLPFGIIVAGTILYQRKKSNKLEKENKPHKKNSKVGLELKDTEHNKEKKKNHQERPLAQRGKDILRTLRANEKKIVLFLIEQKEPIHLSKIHYKTGISKGALFRNIKSLEEKNIISTRFEGRVKRIQLTEWFLEK